MFMGVNFASLQLPTNLIVVVRHVWHAGEVTGGRYWAATMDEDEARAKMRMEAMIAWKCMMGRGVAFFSFSFCFFLEWMWR